MNNANTIWVGKRISISYTADVWTEDVDSLGQVTKGYKPVDCTDTGWCVGVTFQPETPETDTVLGGPPQLVFMLTGRGDGESGSDAVRFHYVPAIESADLHVHVL